MIKASLLSAVLMTSALLHSEAHAGLNNPFTRNRARPDTQVVKDVYAGLKFNYLDREDRLLILQDFLKTVELEYALLPLKAQLIGLDFKKLKEDAIAAENNAADILLASSDRKNEEARSRITFLQAESNMEFLDRMHLLVAQFKDSHFSIQEKIARPLIYNGLRLYRIQNKVVVGSLETKFLAMASKASGTDLSAIKVGDEVISIDGVPVEEKVKELKAFISASSEEFADSQAVRCLTLRNFKYEKKNYMKIEFKNAGTYKLPIFANNSLSATPRLDAITYFDKYGIPSDATSIGMTFDKVTNQWTDSALNFQGYNPRKLHLNLKGITEYAGDDGAPAIRTGYYISKGKTYGVLQLLTFYTQGAKVGDVTVSFLDAIRGFVQELKENELPMILDLRVNGGGNGNYPAAVLGILAEENTITPGPSRGLRMTHYARQIYEPQLHQNVVTEDQSIGLTIDDLQKLIDETLDAHLEYAPMFTMGPVIAEKGFSNKIVALVTADCVSACDMMSFLLKSSKRATIIGTHTNGTGAGFTSSDELSAEWADPLKILTAQVPNFLFGLPGENPITTVFETDSVAKMCSENRPTIADVQYSPTALDFTKNSVGWLQKAAEVLDAK